MTESQQKGKEKRPKGQFKRTVCIHYANGHCECGVSCWFSHGQPELQRAGASERGQRWSGGAKWTVGGPTLDVLESAKMKIAKAAKGPKPVSEAKVKAKEVMQWLQEQREGPEAVEFEKIWKAWCKRHELNKMSKEDRLQRMLVFRQEVEDENEILSWFEAQRNSANVEDFEAEWTKWSEAHNLKHLEKEDRIRSSFEFRRLFEASLEEGRGGILGASTGVICPKGHRLLETVCGNDESFGCDGCEVDIGSGGNIFDCRECDYTLCVACTQEHIKQSGVTSEDPSLCQGEGEAESIEADAQVPRGGAVGPSESRRGGSCPKGHDLLEVVCGEAEFICDACERDVLIGEVVFDCRTCDYCLCDACLSETAETAQEDFPEEVWSDGIVELKDMVAALPSLRLEAASNAEAAELLQSACSQRCKRMAGPLLFAGRHQSLVNTCLGEQNLCAVASTLSLSDFFPMSSLHGADLTRAVLEALCLESRGGSATASPSTRTADALVDFVCLVGLSHFVAVGVTRCFGGNNGASASTSNVPEEEGAVPLPVQQQESEEDARARRVQAQQQMRSAKRWDYTGGYRPADRETNEQATLRLISARHGVVPLSQGASEIQRKLQLGDQEKPEPASLKFKQAICAAFEKGECYKRNCSFAHGQEELAAAKELRAIQTKAAGQDNKKIWELPTHYKHHLCKRWEQHGKCFKGEDCTFAHGKAEWLNYRKDKAQGNMKLHQGPSWEAGPAEATAGPKKISLSTTLSPRHCKKKISLVATLSPRH